MDAIHKFGIGNLELLITRYIIEVFEIQTEICHNDTTCSQVYGKNNKNRSEPSIKISYGDSTQYRKDLKQFVRSMTASSDSSFPLFQQAYSGNTADVETYVEQWHHSTIQWSRIKMHGPVDPPQMQKKLRSIKITFP